MSSPPTPAARESAATTEVLEVISNLVHELRTPLTVIAGYAALLTDSPPEVPADFVDAIARSARTIQRRLDLLADTEEALRGALTLDREDCDLAELVEDVVHGYAPERERNPVCIDVGPTVPVSVDRRRLAQAIGHLLGNAARFSPSGVPIEVSVATEGTAAVITVRDHGPGVPEELRPLLFRRFVPGRAGAAGLGVGLFLTQSIVDAHRGTARYEPALGGGAAFTIEIPCEPGAVRNGAVRQNGRSSGDHPGPDTTATVQTTVLQFEDDEALAGLVERMLSAAAGFTVISSHGAAGSTELVERHRPDVILLDLRLGDADGHDVLRELRADPRTSMVPVVITSGGLTDARIRELRALGAAAVLPKPFCPQQLRTTVREVLDAAGDAAGASAPALTADAADDPLDLRYVEALEELDAGADGDGSIAGLVHTMLDDAHVHLGSLELAANNGDADGAARFAHSLGGAVGNLGAHIVVRQCHELEAAVRAGDVADIVHRVALLADALHAAGAALDARFPGRSELDSAR